MEKNAGTALKAVSFFVVIILSIPTLGLAQEASVDLWTFEKVRTDTNNDRNLDYLGKTVTVTGIANMATGVFHENYLQAFIQNDSTGISLFSKKITTPFKRGDSLVVTGEIQNYKGMAELNVSSYKVFPDAAHPPQPKPLPQAINSPQKYIGMVVEGKGTIIEKGTVYNGKYLRITSSDTSSNSIMVYVSNFNIHYKKFDFDVLSIGDKVSVTGIVGEYNPDFPNQREYKVFLRTPEDLNYAIVPRYYWYLAGGAAVVVLLLVIGWIVMLRRQVHKQTADLKQSLKEKDALLREIHHRVKNSLSIVSGLIGLQLDSTEHQEALSVLKDSQSRIQSVALIHDKLYQTDSLDDVRLDQYLQELVETLHSTFTNYREAVDLKFDLEEVTVDVDTAIHCGLLVNELVVNAFKHAFIVGESGMLEVSLKQFDGTVELLIEDNGPGLPNNFGFDTGESLGSMLIETFAAQLKAETEIVTDKGSGAAFKFAFALDD
ncbi:histidine kinase dimerization/phosphoacceptor domain -containing protein [Fodinibius saliphilus]|uniref:histidine kinase dimerization/phosphoacceptor domain -containing protein n=1 Tax=Fodinibius saliphilus TaxID=1920650 RepID=UPI001109E48F|nr:histidine kinase dimerization/phosphoacceptor domain -containing protein [Fodinibius saliphilus]